MKLTIETEKEKTFEPVVVTIKLESLQDMEDFLARMNAAPATINNPGSWGEQGYKAHNGSYQWFEDGFHQLALLYKELKKK